MAALHFLLPTGDSRSGRRSFDSKHLPPPARRGSRSRPPLRRPRPLRFERLRVPAWNPYSRGRLSPAKSEDRKGGEGKTDANLTNFFSTDLAPLCAFDLAPPVITNRPNLSARSASDGEADGQETQGGT